MYVKRTYIAEDGTEFKFEAQCRAYEAKLFEAQWSETLKPFIALFDHGGKPAHLYHMKEIYYVHVKQVPDFEDESFMDVWDRIIPGSLTSVIASHGTGWYFRGDNEEWFSWARQEAHFNRMKENFEKMSAMLE